MVPILNKFGSSRHAILSREFSGLVKLGVAFLRHGILNDFHSSLRIVNWAYSQTFENRGLTWLRNDELLKLPANWDAGLIILQCDFS